MRSQQGDWKRRDAWRRNHNGTGLALTGDTGLSSMTIEPVPADDRIALINAIQARFNAEALNAVAQGHKPRLPPGLAEVAADTAIKWMRDSGRS